MRAKHTLFRERNYNLEAVISRGFVALVIKIRPHDLAWCALWEAQDHRLHHFDAPLLA